MIITLKIDNKTIDYKSDVIPKIGEQIDIYRNDKENEYVIPAGTYFVANVIHHVKYVVGYYESKANSEKITIHLNKDKWKIH